MDKPQNIQKYKNWLKKTLEIEISDKDETRYKYISSKLMEEMKDSLFWKSLIKSFERLDNEYLLQTGYYLFTANKCPEIQVKSFVSFFEKSFRKNIIQNKNYPDPPTSGWILPQNWFEKTNDIIRVCFVVKYLDGVEFLLENIKNLGQPYKLDFEEHFEARDEGYYAVHLYTKLNFEIPLKTWDTENIDVSFEIQITTQLQDVIRKLTHEYYENRRVRIDKESKKWQWDYKSDDFSANYLGHILHYLEGMIMEIRNKKSEN